MTDDAICDAISDGMEQDPDVVVITNDETTTDGTTTIEKSLDSLNLDPGASSTETLPAIIPTLKTRLKRIGPTLRVLTPRTTPGDLDPSSPSIYPKCIMTFSKLFWQTGQNLKFELLRLAPSIFLQQVCLVATDLDNSEEVDRAYFDQLLIIILLREQLDDSMGVSTPMILGEQPPHDILDCRSTMLKQFFEKKIHMNKEDGTIQVRGLAAIDAPSPNVGTDVEKANEAVPLRRTKSKSYSNFVDMHGSMATKMESVRRKTATAQDGLNATRMAMIAVSKFDSMMTGHRTRVSAAKKWSIAKKRWKKAIRRIIMDAAVARTRAHLEELGLA